MALLDAPFRSLARTLVGTFGATGVLEYMTTGDYDPTTGTAVGNVPVAVNVRGVLEAYTEHEVDGSVIRQGDLRWTMAAAAVSRLAA